MIPKTKAHLYYTLLYGMQSYSLVWFLGNNRLATATQHNRDAICNADPLALTCFVTHLVRVNELGRRKSYEQVEIQVFSVRTC